MKIKSLPALVCLCFCQPNLYAQEPDLNISVVNKPPTETINRWYGGNRSPLLPLYFIKLPIGSIRPEGWILKYLELQRDGLTGHLGEISAWLDKKNNAWFSGNGQGDHGWEEVPYWLKGYGDLGYILKNQQIIAETRSWLEKVFQSQTTDGYFGPRIFEKPDEDHTGKTPDLWPNMIMLWCMQSYYEYSHDGRVIDFMKKYFQWQSQVPDSSLLRLYWEHSRGGDNLLSIYWLYNITGDQWLLGLADKIHHATADWSQENNLPNWHNVNIAQGFREPATYFMQSKDSSFYRATYRDFELVRNLYGQVPGGMFGADEDARPGYTDPRQAVETCGMVEQMSSDEILTAITGDPLWADNCEDVAFNTYPAAVMPDFRGLRYLTAPNMVVSDGNNHAPGIQNEGPFLMMNPFSSRCCQHNHSQGWPYYAEHLWMATPDNGLAAILYCDNTVTAKAGDNDASPVTLKETTHYPFDENIRITVGLSSPEKFPLYLRIPGWCNDAEVLLNGRALNIHSGPDTYLRIDRLWSNNDLIELKLPMKVALHTWTNNKNSVSVNYGPLTFSLKIAESYKQMNGKEYVQADSKWQANADPKQWPSYEIHPASAWNYGLVISSDSLLQYEILKRPWPADDFPFTQTHTPLVIRTVGKEIPGWTIDQYGLCGVLPPSPVKTDRGAIDIELIPMGCARLRISSFPQVQ